MITSFRSILAAAATAVAALASSVHAQAPAAPATAAPAAAVPARTLNDATGDMQKRLEDALKELSDQRGRIAEEKVPLMRRLNDVEQQVSDARKKFQETTRILDTRSLGLGDLQKNIKAGEEEVAYLANLLVEYLRNFESGLHITELQRYRQELDAAKKASENEEISQRDLFEVQATVLAASLERLHGAFGGSRFEGSVVDPEGTVNQGTFVLAGPSAIFRAMDGSTAGTAEQKLGSLEPSLTPFQSPEMREKAGDYIANGIGGMPFDPTMGNAHRIAQTEETLIEHILKGGPVMYPIIGLGAVAMLVALYKWITMLFVWLPSQRKVRAILKAIGAGEFTNAANLAGKIGGPMGKMLQAGTAVLGLPRDVVEESMFEVMQRTQMRLQSMLPFIAICASAAPLLGLLGTVTGIMNTFTMIEVYGTGDVKTLSGGISEALITTEYGLIVSIPSLLLYAYLSSKARKVVNRMESTGVSFMNEVARREHTATAQAA
jgi:biopolymer transport protein ExbB